MTDIEAVRWIMMVEQECIRRAWIMKALYTVDEAQAWRITHNIRQVVGMYE